MPFKGKEVGITPGASLAAVIEPSVTFSVVTALFASLAVVTDTSVILEVVIALSASFAEVITPAAICGAG